MHECNDLFKIACFFESEPLQELLVAQEIVPNMTSNSAILYMQEYPPNVNDYNVDKVRMPIERPRKFLNDYCLHFMSRNFAKIIRSSQQ